MIWLTHLTSALFLNQVLNQKLIIDSSILNIIRRLTTARAQSPPSGRCATAQWDALQGQNYLSYQPYIKLSRIYLYPLTILANKILYLSSNQTVCIIVQGQSLTVTPLTVTVGYSDTFSDSQTISNGFQVVTVTNMLLQWHVLGHFQLKMRVKWPKFGLLGIFMTTTLPQIILYTSIKLTKSSFRLFES